MHIPSFRRKPFLITLGIITGILFVHLIGIYIYAGGTYVGLPGGSISIGTIGKTPNALNPLTYGQNPLDDLMFQFLFRGLITYNPLTENAEGDLATCDLGDLSKVTCQLKQGMRWSDDTAVKDEDVIASIQAFRETIRGREGKMSTFISGVSVVSNKDGIVIQSKEKNPLMIELLNYPIIRSDMIEQIRTSRFSSGNYISSGLYKFGEIATDTEYGSDRITLIKNEKYSGQIAWLDKIHFKFFQDIGSLERSTDTLSIIIPPVKSEKLSLSARFKAYKYSTYEFFGVFFHTDRLSKELRNGLHWQIGTSFSGNIDPDHHEITSIFSTGGTILPTGNLGNFSDILRKNGYLKKDEWLAKLDQEPTTVTGGVQYEVPKYFQNKENALILYTNDASGGILLRGNVPVGTQSVTINNYTLKEFTPGNKSFAYRVTFENGTVQEGKNTYTLSFGTGGSSGETLSLYYSPDESTLKKLKDEVDATYLSRLNTPAFIAARERDKATRRTKLEAYDDRYFYNSKGEPFELTVAYVNGMQSTEQYAKVIESTLKNLSIITKLVALEPKDLDSIIKTGKKEYDMIVLGIDTNGNIAQIGQLFATSEAGKGVNFANIESKTLDELFATLRSSTEQSAIDTTKTKIVTFMQNESFFFPIASPTHTLYTDRNLKGIKQIDIFPSITTVYDILNYASIKDAYTLNTKGKGIGNFIGWLFNEAFR